MKKSELRKIIREEITQIIRNKISESAESGIIVSLNSKNHMCYWGSESDVNSLYKYLDKLSNTGHATMTLYKSKSNYDTTCSKLNAVNSSPKDIMNTVKK